MKKTTLHLWRFVTPLALLLSCGSLSAIARHAPQENPQTPADNTSRNKDQAPPTADQQKMNAADRTITQKIRHLIHQDKTLSTYAHNIKIITQNGKVTLRGPVRTAKEKTNLQAKAATVAGEENVTNQLEIARSK